MFFNLIVFLRFPRWGARQSHLKAFLYSGSVCTHMDSWNVNDSSLCMGTMVDLFFLFQMSVTFICPCLAPCCAVLWIVPSGRIHHTTFPYFGISFTKFLLSGLWIYDRNTFSIFIKKICFFLLCSPSVIFLKGAHGKETVDMGIAPVFIVNDPIRTHTLRDKVLYDIF